MQNLQKCKHLYKSLAYRKRYNNIKLSSIKHHIFKANYCDGSNSKGNQSEQNEACENKNEKNVGQFNIFAEQCHWIRQLQPGESDPTHDGMYGNHMMYHKYTYFETYNHLSKYRNPQPSSTQKIVTQSHQPDPSEVPPPRSFIKIVEKKTQSSNRKQPPKSSPSRGGGSAPTVLALPPGRRTTSDKTAGKLKGASFKAVLYKKNDQSHTDTVLAATDASPVASEVGNSPKDDLNNVEDIKIKDLYIKAFLTKGVLSKATSSLDNLIETKLTKRKDSTTEPIFKDQQNTDAEKMTILVTTKKNTKVINKANFRKPLLIALKNRKSTKDGLSSIITKPILKLKNEINTEVEEILTENTNLTSSTDIIAKNENDFNSSSLSSIITKPILTSSKLINEENTEVKEMLAENTNATSNTDIITKNENDFNSSSKVKNIIIEDIKVIPVSSKDKLTETNNAEENNMEAEIWVQLKNDERSASNINVNSKSDDKASIIVPDSKNAWDQLKAATQSTFLSDIDESTESTLHSDTKVKKKLLEDIVPMSVSPRDELRENKNATENITVEMMTQSKNKTETSETSRNIVLPNTESTSEKSNNNSKSTYLSDIDESAENLLKSWNFSNESNKQPNHNIGVYVSQAAFISKIDKSVKSNPVKITKEDITVMNKLEVKSDDLNKIVKSLLTPSELKSTKPPDIKSNEIKLSQDPKESSKEEQKVIEIQETLSTESITSTSKEQRLINFENMLAVLGPKSITLSNSEGQKIFNFDKTELSNSKISDSGKSVTKNSILSYNPQDPQRRSKSTGSKSSIPESNSTKIETTKEPINATKSFIPFTYSILTNTTEKEENLTKNKQISDKYIFSGTTSPKNETYPDFIMCLKVTNTEKQHDNQSKKPVKSIEKFDVLGKYVNKTLNSTLSQIINEEKSVPKRVKKTVKPNNETLSDITILSKSKLEQVSLLTSKKLRREYQKTKPLKQKFQPTTISTQKLLKNMKFMRDETNVSVKDKATKAKKMNLLSTLFASNSEVQSKEKQPIDSKSSINHFRHEPIKSSIISKSLILSNLEKHLTATNDDNNINKYFQYMLEDSVRRQSAIESKQCKQTNTSTAKKSNQEFRKKRPLKWKFKPETHTIQKLQAFPISHESKESKLPKESKISETIKLDTNTVLSIKPESKSIQHNQKKEQLTIKEQVIPLSTIYFDPKILSDVEISFKISRTRKRIKASDPANSASFQVCRKFETLPHFTIPSKQTKAKDSVIKRELKSTNGMISSKISKLKEIFSKNPKSSIESSKPQVVRPIIEIRENLTSNETIDRITAKSKETNLKSVCNTLSNSSRQFKLTNKTKALKKKHAKQIETKEIIPKDQMKTLKSELKKCMEHAKHIETRKIIPEDQINIVKSEPKKCMEQIETKEIIPKDQINILNSEPKKGMEKINFIDKKLAELTEEVKSINNIRIKENEKITEEQIKLKANHQLQDAVLDSAEPIIILKKKTHIKSAEIKNQNKIEIIEPVIIVKKKKLLKKGSKNFTDTELSKLVQNSKNEDSKIFMNTEVDDKNKKSIDSTNENIFIPVLLDHKESEKNKNHMKVSKYPKEITNIFKVDKKKISHNIPQTTIINDSLLNSKQYCKPILLSTQEKHSTTNNETTKNSRPESVESEQPKSDAKLKETEQIQPMKSKKSKRKIPEPDPLKWKFNPPPKTPPIPELKILRKTYIPKESEIIEDMKPEPIKEEQRYNNEENLPKKLSQFKIRRNVNEPPLPFSYKPLNETLTRNSEKKKLDMTGDKSKIEETKLSNERTGEYRKSEVKDNIRKFELNKHKPEAKEHKSQLRDNKFKSPPLESFLKKSKMLTSEEDLSKKLYTKILISKNNEIKADTNITQLKAEESKFDMEEEEDQKESITSKNINLIEKKTTSNIVSKDNEITEQRKKFYNQLPPPTDKINVQNNELSMTDLSQDKYKENSGERVEITKNSSLPNNIDETRLENYQFRTADFPTNKYKENSKAEEFEITMTNVTSETEPKLLQESEKQKKSKTSNYFEQNENEEFQMNKLYEENKDEKQTYEMNVKSENQQKNTGDLPHLKNIVPTPIVLLPTESDKSDETKNVHDSNKHNDRVQESTLLSKDPNSFTSEPRTNMLEHKKAEKYSNKINNQKNESFLSNIDESMENILEPKSSASESVSNPSKLNYWEKKIKHTFKDNSKINDKILGRDTRKTFLSDVDEYVENNVKSDIISESDFDNIKYRKGRNKNESFLSNIDESMENILEPKSSASESGSNPSEQSYWEKKIKNILKDNSKKNDKILGKDTRTTFLSHVDEYVENNIKSGIISETDFDNIKYRKGPNVTQAEFLSKIAKPKESTNINSVKIEEVKETKSEESFPVLNENDNEIDEVTTNHGDENIKKFIDEVKSIDTIIPVQLYVISSTDSKKPTNLEHKIKTIGKIDNSFIPDGSRIKTDSAKNFKVVVKAVPIPDKDKIKGDSSIPLEGGNLLYLNNSNVATETKSDTKKKEVQKEYDSLDFSDTNLYIKTTISIPDIIKNAEQIDADGSNLLLESNLLDIKHPDIVVRTRQIKNDNLIISKFKLKNIPTPPPNNSESR